MDTTDERAKIIERIRKVLERSHANSGALEGEINIALDMARKLMDKFNLTLKDIETSPSKRQEVYDSLMVSPAFERAYRIDSFDLSLAWTIDMICDTRHYVTTYQHNKEGKLHRSSSGCVRPLQVLFIRGMPYDVELGVQLYKELRATMAATERMSLGNKRSFAMHAAYCQGFADRLYERSKEIRDSSMAQSHTTAIVISKGALLDRQGTALGLRAGRKSKRLDRTDNGAYFAGREDAESVDLGLRRNKLSNTEGKSLDQQC